MHESDEQYERELEVRVAARTEELTGFVFQLPQNSPEMRHAGAGLDGSTDPR